MRSSTVPCWQVLDVPSQQLLLIEVQPGFDDITPGLLEPSKGPACEQSSTVPCWQVPHAPDQQLAAGTTFPIADHRLNQTATRDLQTVQAGR